MDTLFLNAGLIPIKKMDIKTGAWNLLTRPSYVAKTGGDVILQHVGLVNDEGLGDTFAANVFGHWLLVRELTPLLATSEYGGKAVWFTSTTADPDFFDPKDYQCIKG
jgi:17beta-estradiol 17-dehydrogenase/3beta-hydroxysteroid 3-dehydrogenase